MTTPLKDFDILRDLSAEERENLQDFLEERSYDDRRAIFRRHDEAAELLLLTQGCIRLESDGEDLGELTPGSALGHASLVRIGQRACAAYAKGSVSVLKLSREAYLRLRGDYPQIALTLQEGILSSFAETVREVLPGRS